jgi:REP element-mobilizing transposase RayT
MPSSYTSLHYHIIFSTKERRPLVTDDIRGRLYEYMRGVIRNEACFLRAIGGMPDHIHLLMTSHATKSVADLMRVVKTNSSKWIHEAFPDHRAFGWQDGYGAFTVSESAIADVQRYIENQSEHHKRRSFQDEFIEFLQRHGIEFDPRYLWT